MIFIQATWGPSFSRALSTIFPILQPEAEVSEFPDDSFAEPVPVGDAAQHEGAPRQPLRLDAATAAADDLQPCSVDSKHHHQPGKKNFEVRC